MDRKNNPPVDIELAHELLRYDSETGLHYWKVDRTGGVKAGDVAGYLKSDGYVYIRLLGKGYSAHRLGYAMYYNDNLDGYEVNHINHITDDNKISNLSRVDRSGQMRDKAMQSNNTSGYTGVDWHKSSQKWRARVSEKIVGYFDDVELAGFAAELTRDKLGYSPNHGRPLEDVQSDYEKLQQNQ